MANLRNKNSNHESNTLTEIIHRREKQFHTKEKSLELFTLCSKRFYVSQEYVCVIILERLDNAACSGYEGLRLQTSKLKRVILVTGWYTFL